MSFTNRTDADTLSVRRVSPWPTALWVTSATLALTFVICFAFPNG
ncbi:hypothetical protein [Stappia sp.]|jgi:hypothetical protein